MCVIKEWRTAERNLSCEKKEDKFDILINIVLVHKLFSDVKNKYSNTIHYIE